MTDELITTKRFDPPAIRALIMAAIVAILIFVAYANMGGALLEQTWLVLLSIFIILVGIGFVYFYTRKAHVVWRHFQKNFSQSFDDMQTKSVLGTGAGTIGTSRYLGLSTFCSPKGIEIRGIMLPPISIPWSAISHIDAKPGVLTGKKGFESDMEGIMKLRDHPSVPLQFPWLKEFRELAPKTVKYREFKIADGQT